MEIATKSDLSVFPLSRMIELVTMKFPMYSEKIEHMAKLSDYLDGTIRQVERHIRKINRLMEKDIIFL